MPDKLLIIGAGHGAGQLVASLRQKKYAGRIGLIGDEPHYPYQRPPLSKKFLAGEMPAERLYVKPPSFYEDDVDVCLGRQVVSIDRSARQVTDDTGESRDYDKLVLATGARVRKIDVPGATLAGVHYLRNIQDVSQMHERMHAGARIVIVGAGYIGLEVAAVARTMGLDVTVLEMASRVMSRVVSESVSRFYEKEHTGKGVKLMLNASLQGFAGDDGQVTQVRLVDGATIPADLVLIGVGVLPNSELAERAKLDVDNGIVVDSRCRTSDPDIYAIGDCTNHPNALLQRRLRLESVHNALEQAKTVAGNLCDDDMEYAQIPWFWSDQYDLKLQIAGLSQGYDETVIRGDPASRSFSCLYLRDGQLIAVDAINSPRDFMQSKPLIAAGKVIDTGRLADPAIPLKDMS